MEKLITFSLLIGFMLSAEAQFKLSGEIRPRFEYRHGFQSLVNQDQDPAFFTEQRTRLNAEFWKENYSMKIVLQDVRVWGSQSQLVNNGGSLTALHEAWAKVSLSDISSLKLGRQEIILDDSRMFGNVDWAQQARSHDAALYEMKKNDFMLTLAAAYNQDGVQSTTNFYTVPRSYKTFQFLWFQNQLGQIKTSFLFLNNGLQGGMVLDSDTYFSQTFGVRVVATEGSFQPSGAFYYQSGKDGTGISTSAYDLQLDFTYKLSEKANLKLGFESLSGNDEVNPSSDNKAFNPFYGTNHKFNGLMDYFYVGNHIGSVGLNDIYLQLDAPISTWSSSLALHYFASQTDQLDPVTNAAADRYLGTEIDWVLTRKISDDIKFNLGYSQLFSSSSMELLKGGNAGANNNWAWMMLTIKPAFFQIESQ